MTAAPVDLGDGHTLRFVRWGPDRELNPKYAGQPDIDPCGAIVDHLMPDGSTCSGMVLFDLPGMAELWPGRDRWTVEAIDPLTLSPSIKCKCGDHGYIRNGKWERS